MTQRLGYRMRRFACLLLTFIYLTSAFGAEIKIRTLILDGKPAYVLYAGTFPTEEAAQKQKQELPADLTLDANIEHDSDSHQYILKLGPTRDYEQAKALQHELSSTDSHEAKTNMASLTTAAGLPESQQAQMQTTLPSTPTMGEQDSGTKLWNLNNADIRAVIAEVSRVTGKNFVIDPRVQGKISIVSNTPLSNKALYQVFLSMLQLSGYAAIPSGKVVKIIPNLDAKTLSPDTLSLLKHPPMGDEMMVSVIPVHYVPAEQLVPVLRPLMPQWSYVSAYAPSNMLILSGRADNVKQLSEIIKQVDSSSNSDIDVVPLHYALAMDVANTLKDLVKATGASMNRLQTTLAVDDRNNAILLGGNKTDRLRLRIIISKLDHQTSASVGNNTQVIYLNYLRAEDLVPILAGVAQANFSGTVGTTIGTITLPELDSTNPASSLANDNGPYSTQPPPTTPKPVTQATSNTSSANTQNEGGSKPHIQIIAEPNTNSIILNAPSSIIRILKTVIHQLDIRPAQILIEAMVAEINKSDINSLGIEWGSLGQGKNSNGFRPGFAIINSKTSINDFQAQVYALEKESKANVLSTPSVLVLDNRQAKILVGKQVSVAATSYPNNAGGTTVSSSPYTTFNRVNVALHLYVRPQITRDQGIQLQIDQGNDTLDPGSEVGDNSNGNPTFRISSIVTAVHVQSGDIVILGGLAENSLGNENSSIPILKDIPGLGRIFQHNIRSTEKRVLMVFIRPIILKNPADTVRVTGSKYNDTREEELAFVRSQEQYIPTDKQTILSPLHQARLPTPFTPMTTK